MIRVKDLVQDVKDFYTPTYYYNYISMCTYRGFVGNSVFGGFPSEFDRFKNFHQYSEQGSTYYRKTLGLGKLIAEYLAKNIFAEDPEIVVGSEAVNTQMHEILDDNRFGTKERSQFETQVAVGARIIKPYVDNDKIKLDYVTDPVFFVTDTKDGDVTGIVLMSQTKKTEKPAFGKPKVFYYTRLEWHYPDENGNRFVKYEMYKGENIGHFKWRCNLNKFLDVYGELIEEEVVPYKTKRPTFIYVKNPIKNNKDMGSVEGLSALANSLGSQKAADESYDSMSDEIDLGRIRIFVPELSMDEVLDVKSAKPIRHFDAKKKVFTIYSSSDMSDNKPEVASPTLRIDQILMALNANIDVVSTQVGVSAGSFRFDGKSIITATQVISEKSDTARTVKMYEGSLTQAYVDLFLLIKDFVNLETTGSMGEFTEKDITITWKDNVVVDDEKIREEDRELVDKGYMPKWAYLVKHEGKTEAEAKKSVADAVEEEILSDQAYSAATGFDRDGNPLTDPDNNDETIKNNILETQGDNSYNGAQIKAAIDIVKEFAEGALSRESAISMLMEFLLVDQATAGKMLILDKSNLDDDIVPKKNEDDDDIDE